METKEILILKWFVVSIIPLIPIIAYLDTFIFPSNYFWYFTFCSAESLVFYIGIWVGKVIYGCNTNNQE
jgi:hypothetical protein